MGGNGLRRYAESRRGCVICFRAHGFVKAAVLVALCCLSAPAGRAQQRQAREEDRRSVYDHALLQLAPHARGRIAAGDTVWTLRTRSLSDGRADLETGFLHARYRIGDRVEEGLSTTQAALAYLEQHGEAYGITAAGEHLRVEQVREGRYARHVRYRQTLAGVPVYRADVAVSLDRSGQPTMVVSSYQPHLERVRGFDPAPALSSAAAQDIARRAATPELAVSEPALVVYVSDVPRLVWNVPAVSSGLPVSWDVLVDARTGEIHRIFNTSLHAHKASSLSSGALGASSSAHASPAPAAKPRVSPVVHAPPPVPFDFSAPAFGQKARVVDGMGLVFDPDPLTSAGVSYGGAYQDGDDADTAALTEQRVRVTLRDITQGADGLYRLDGPYVRIRGDPHVVPEASAPDAFDFTRSDDRFEAVNAYYHIDKSRRYAQSLDLGYTVLDVPVNVNPQAFAADNSAYIPHDRLLQFGTGGIDDAEDADVLWHEYAHALLDHAAPGLIGPFEGRALHEGWADYWAASYSRFLSEEDSRIPSHAWERLYNWDGNASCWSGRTLDHMGHYDDDMAYESAGCQAFLEIYQWGLLWATTMMKIYSHVGRPVMDRLHLASHAYLGSGGTFRDAAEALIQADEDIYEGLHTGALVHELGEAGYIDSDAYGPALAHDPPDRTENIGGTVEIRVEAKGLAAPVDRVFLRYSPGEGLPWGIFPLMRRDDTLFAGDFPVPDEPTVVRYYIEGHDTQGRYRLLPALAPRTVFTLDVGQDRTAPSLVHDALARIPVAAWPATVYAEASDDLGVDTVWVEYVRHSAGDTREEGAFGLTEQDGRYSGSFPEPTSPVLGGDKVEYRLVARDVSEAGNEARLPEEGFFSVLLILEGELYAFDFERDEPGITTQGWRRGPPAFGLRMAYSGENAWATAPDGAYPVEAGRATLDLPPVRLTTAPSAYLIFWHWYDFEQGGPVAPGLFDARADLRDGGNVKVSLDGGVSWEVLVPEGGYTGNIGGRGGNPLAGQPGFGGYSFGWRREIVPVPISGDVRVRFEAGTDAGNEGEARYFAGWYLDQVSLVTERPQDADAPWAEGLPAERVAHVVGRDLLAPVSIRAYDNTGVESVISRYEITDARGVATGSVRWAMSGVDARVFEGHVAPPQSFSPGDRVAYTIHVRDFDGNETAYGAPFAIDYRSEAYATVAPVSVAPAGVWRRVEGGWIARDPGSGASGAAVSSLVFAPVTIPSNSESTALELAQAYTLGENFGGNVKITEDDGVTWRVIAPAEGYDGKYAPAGEHPMQDEAVFGGGANGSGAVSFDLTGYAGKAVRLRIDLAHAAAFGPDTVWRIGNIGYRSLSPDDAIEVPRELVLHPNFPDPVRTVTHISYTIPGDEALPVRLTAYDVTGRRVAVLRDQMQEPGTYTVHYDAGQLASGAYILHLETPRGIRIERMMVIR